MKNEIFDNMLSRYDLTTEQQKRNAIFEANQQMILAGLYAGGFFESAAFYGGTCLRIFHGLQRFSEDMDFSLLTQDDKFDFTKYFPAIIDAFTMVGREVEIKKKDKRNFGKVESAFLKDNTDVYDVTFQTEKSIKIKIEVDTCPPLNFKTEQKLLLQPYSFMTRCLTLPDLFAGKMHALVYRAWKNRVIPFPVKLAEEMIAPTNRPPFLAFNVVIRTTCSNFSGPQSFRKPIASSGMNGLAIMILNSERISV